MAFGFRGLNRLADPNVAAINAKLRAQAQAGQPLQFPKTAIGIGSTGVPGTPVNLPGLGVAPGFGTPFQGALSPQDQFLKAFQKLRGTGGLPAAAQGLNSTGILNAFAGARPTIGADPFGQEVLQKIGSKANSLLGLNSGAGLLPQPVPVPQSQPRFFTGGSPIEGLLKDFSKRRSLGLAPGGAGSPISAFRGNPFVGLGSGKQTKPSLGGFGFGF